MSENVTIDRGAGNQTPRHVSPAGDRLPQVATQSAAQHMRRLLSDKEAARVLGIGERTYAELIATADWLPTPIVLGPRLRRWDADELIEAARTRAPRGTKGQEPAQLRRARIERIKATGNASA